MAGMRGLAMQQARAIVEQEIDLEIYLHTAQLALLQQELKRAQQLAACLRALHLQAAAPPPPAEHSANLYEFSCLERRYFQLACPECSRRQFASQLGFANHCRIQHEVVFAGQEDRIARCGQPVEASEVPQRQQEDGHGRQTHINLSLAQLRSEASKNQARQRIAVHDSQQPLDVGAAPQAAAAAALRLPELPLPPAPAFTPLAAAAGQPAAGGEPTLESSRFYFSRLLAIGNLAKTFYVPESGKWLYRWKLYVRDCSGGAPLDGFLRSMRVTLHASYGPEAEVTLTQAPWTVTRAGWGEFPVAVRLAFSGAKELAVYYALKLSPGRGCQDWVLGGERQFAVQVEKAAMEAASLAAGEPQPALQAAGGGLPAAPHPPARQAAPARSGRHCKFCGCSHGSQKKCRSHAEAEDFFSGTPMPPQFLCEAAAVPPPPLLPPPVGQAAAAAPCQQQSKNNWELLAGSQAAALRLQPASSAALGLLGAAGKNFCKRLLLLCVAAAREGTQRRKAAPAGPAGCLVTPLHLYEVVNGREELSDWLSSKHLLR